MSAKRRACFGRLVGLMGRAVSVLTYGKIGRIDDRIPAACHLGKRGSYVGVYGANEGKSRKESVLGLSLSARCGRSDGQADQIGLFAKAIRCPSDRPHLADNDKPRTLSFRDLPSLAP